MRRVLQRTCVVSVVTAGLGLGLAAPALAAVGNDNVGSASVIASLPYTHTEYTTTATAASTDPTDCGALAGTVWFRYKATAAGRLTASTVGSNYSTIVAVYQGKPTATSHVTNCNYIAVDFTTKVGATYFIMVGRCCDEGPGFKLVFHLVRPPTLSVHVNLHGTVRWLDGVATVSGTVTCSRKLDAYIDLSLVQRVSRTLLATGGVSILVAGCISSPTAWSAKVVPNGFVPFVTGAAVATLDWYGCDAIGSCSDQTFAAPVTITLTSG